MHQKAKYYLQTILVMLLLFVVMNNNVFACKKNKRHKKIKCGLTSAPLKLVEKKLTIDEEIKKIDSLLTTDFYISSYQKSKAYAERAYYKLQKDDSLEALDDCCVSIQYDSTYYYPYYLSGSYYGKIDQNQQSIDIANIGLLNCSNGTLKLFRLKANNLQGLEKYDEALSMYNVLIDNSRDDGSNFYNKGTILLKKRKYYLAISNLKNSLYKYEERENGYRYNIAAYNNIAYSYLLLNKYASAIENYTEALKIKKNTISYLGLCLAYDKLNNEEKLVENFNFALEQRPNLKNGMQEINKMIINYNYFYFPESLTQLDTIFKIKLK